jgi:RHS repeat-associated protein
MKATKYETKTVLKMVKEAGMYYMEINQVYHSNRSLKLNTTSSNNFAHGYAGDLQHVEVFYFHSDHLGSSNYVSNYDGDISQHAEYLPFGELLTDEHLNSHNTRYKYNGKEFDQETGNYYYGVRYYNPKTSLWLSVDPLAHEYPLISPYAYVANNPINAIDPDGRKIIFINGKLGGGSPSGGKAYWNNSFVQGAKDYLYDDKAYFVNTDYSYFSSASGRTNQGYEWAKNNYETLIEGMSEGEVFNMVSHSMGGAYSKGVEKYLEEKGWEVQTNVMINTFQVDDIEVGDNDATYNIDYQNTDDPVLFWFDTNLGYGELENANATIREESGEETTSFKHRSPIDGGRKFWDNLDQKIIESEKTKQE